MDFSSRLWLGKTVLHNKLDVTGNFIEKNEMAVRNCLYHRQGVNLKTKLVLIIKAIKQAFYHHNTMFNISYTNSQKIVTLKPKKLGTGTDYQISTIRNNSRIKSK